MKFLIAILFTVCCNVFAYATLNFQNRCFPTDTFPGLDEVKLDSYNLLTTEINSSAAISPSMGLLTIEGGSVAKEGRRLLILDNRSEDSFSATILDILTGIDSANIGSGYIATYAKSYSVVPGYGGYMVVNSNPGMPGLVIRAQDENGLIRFLVGGTDFINEKMQINNSGLVKIMQGDVYLENMDKGIIMKSANGQCWRYTPDNTGQLVSTNVTCP